MQTITSPLEHALDTLGEFDPAALGDGDTVVALHREYERLGAVLARATAAFDARRDWEADRARSAASWIATMRNLPVASAKRRMWLGRSLRDMAVVEQAWLGGDIGDAQVALLAKAQSRAPECFARDQELLVGYGRTKRYSHFARLVAYWLQRADPDGTEADAHKAHDARRLHLSQSLGGMWFLDGAFDPIGGEILSSVLKRIEDEFFDADWAQAKARVGNSPTVADLARTPAQRRADALIEMARRAAAVAPGSRLPAPLFTVLVGYENSLRRILELASGTVVSPGSLVPWLSEAYIERIVFDGPSRVIDVGARRRLFTGALRRALEVRDRECQHPFCEEPASNCEADHIEPYGAGGATIEANGRMGCGPHNRGRHKRRIGPPVPVGDGGRES